MIYSNNSPIKPLAPKVIMIRDKSSFFQKLESEGQCDCACPHVPGSSLISCPSISSTLIQNPSLEVIKLDEMHYAMFIPSGGHIAVLNATAIELLDTFREPREIEQWLPVLKQTWLDKARSTIDDLIQLRFLVAPDNLSIPKPLENVKTLVAWLHVTNECNLRCQYCYISKTPEEMSTEIGYAAIDAIFRSSIFHGLKSIKLKYAGGEATLSFPMITRLHEYATDLAMEYGCALDGVVLSNGVGITRDMIDAMLNHRLRLMISLDGIGASHDTQRPFANGAGSFQAVSRSIERAQMRGLVPDISITVSNRNIDSLPETVGWVLERDLPFSINFFRENDASASFLDLRLDEPRLIKGMLATFKVVEAKLPRRSLLASLVDLSNLAMTHARTCSVGTNYMVIDHRGGIAKCQMHINQTVADVGTIDPLTLIRADQIGIQNLSVDEKEGCRDCRWRYWCTGGCPLTTFRATGRYDIKSPHCNIYKTLYPEAVRLEGLRLLKYANDVLDNYDTG